MKKRTYLKVLTIAVVGLFAASCAQDDSFIPLVPSNAIAVVKINQGELLLKNLDEILAASPFASQLGGMSVRSLLGLMLSTSAAKMTLSDIDLTKPIGAAFLPPESGAEFGIALYIPSLKPDDLKTKLSAFAADGTTVFSAKNYAVLAMGVPSLSAPPKTSLAIRGNVTQKENEIMIYVPAKELLAAHQTEWQEFKTQDFSDEFLKDALADIPSGLNGDGMMKFMSGFRDLAVQTVESTDSLVAFISMDKNFFDIKTRINFGTDSPVAKGLKNIPEGTLQTQDFDVLPESHLVAFGMSIKPEAFKGITDALVDAAIPMLGFSESETKEYKDLMNEAYSLYGEKSIASFDYKLDMAALQSIESTGTTPDYSTLSKAFSFAAYVKSDITSADAMSAYLEKSINSPAIKNMLNRLYGSMGLTGGFSIEKAQVDGKAYQTVSYSLAPATNSDAEATLDSAETALITSLLDSLKIAFLAEGKSMYMAVPDADQGASLKSFMDGKLSDKSLGKNKSYADWFKNIPAGSQFVYRMNMDSLIAMAQNIPAETKADRLGMCGYIKLGSQSIDSGFSMGMSEIFDIVNIAMQVGLGVPENN